MIGDIITKMIEFYEVLLLKYDMKKKLYTSTYLTKIIGFFPIML